jgi:hypothetical protein
MSGRLAYVVVVPLRSVVKRVFRVRDWARTRRRQREVEAEQAAHGVSPR